MKTILPCIFLGTMILMGIQLDAQGVADSSFGEYEVWLNISPIEPKLHTENAYGFYPPYQTSFWEGFLKKYRQGEIQLFMDWECTKVIHPHALWDYLGQQQFFAFYKERDSLIRELDLPLDAPKEQGLRLTENPDFRAKEDSFLAEIIYQSSGDIWLKERWNITSGSTQFEQEAIGIRLHEGFGPVHLFLDLRASHVFMKDLFRMGIAGIGEVDYQTALDRRLFNASLVGMRVADSEEWMLFPKEEYMRREKKLALVDSLLSPINYPEIRAEMTKEHYELSKMTKPRFVTYLEKDPMGFTAADSSVYSIEQFERTFKFLDSYLNKIYESCLDGKLPAYEELSYGKISEDPLSREEMVAILLTEKEEVIADSSYHPGEEEIIAQDIFTVGSKLKVIGKLIENEGKKTFTPEFMILVFVDSGRLYPAQSLWAVRFDDLEKMGWTFQGKSITEFIKGLNYFYYPIEVNGRGLRSYKEAFWLKERLLEWPWKEINWKEYVEKFRE